MCAIEMGVSEQTAKNYLRDIFDRAGVWTRLELACRYAWEWKAGLYPGTPNPLNLYGKVPPRRASTGNPRGVNRWTKPAVCPPAIIPEQLPAEMPEAAL